MSKDSSVGNEQLQLSMLQQKACALLFCAVFSICLNRHLSPNLQDLCFQKLKHASCGASDRGAEVPPVRGWKAFASLGVFAAN